MQIPQGDLRKLEVKAKEQAEKERKINKDRVIKHQKTADDAPMLYGCLSVCPIQLFFQNWVPIALEVSHEKSNPPVINQQTTQMRRHYITKKAETQQRAKNMKKLHALEQ